MVVGSHFLRWMDTARVEERVAAAGGLAQAYVDRQLAFEDHCAAEAALTLLLDDPSPRVRLAMAEPLSMSRHAPVQVIAALAADQIEIACLVLARSPLVSEADLIDRIATAPLAVQVVIANRAHIGIGLSAALAEIGEPQACLALLDNVTAQIAACSYRRMVERFGHLGTFREALLAHSALPSEARHVLLLELGRTLGASPFLHGVMGAGRAERVAQDACLRASMTLIESSMPGEHRALVEHLRLRGDLTAGFLIRAVACGQIDFFGAALVVLTGQNDRRVRALLASGRDVAVAALMKAAGLGTSLHAAIIGALRLWREVATGKRVAGIQEVSWSMLQAIGANADLSALLRRIHLDALRDNARNHARALAA